MKRWGLVLTGLAVLVGMGVVSWRLANSRTVQLFGEIVARVETDDSVVALTFDDGPTAAGADSILAILRREGIRATFFFTGSELAANPGLGDRFVREGHELGNHSYSHQRMLLKSPGFIRSEIETTDSLIRRTGYSGPIHFRPPYGKKLIGLPWYLSRTHRTTITFDLDPDSNPDPTRGAAGIAEQTVAAARPGSIILLHVMYASRIESLRAVPDIINGLEARGFRFVTVSELLESSAVPVIHKPFTLAGLIRILEDFARANSLHTSNGVPATLEG